MIDRAFCRLDAGLIHYRFAGKGEGPPLLMAHGGPGSSAGLVPLIDDLASGRRVIAPDMMGNGNSDPPPPGPPTIAFYAECIAALLDQLGIEQVDAYGHHTGAQVVAQLAVNAPGRVRRLVLDGAALFPDARRAEFLTKYAPPIVPDSEGGHFAWAWNFARELTVHFPHYRRDEAHRLRPGLALPPEIITRTAAEVLNSWQTYHLSYQAAFRHDFRSALERLHAPTLVLELGGDPLATYAHEVAAILTRGRVAQVARAERGSAVDSFLRS